MALSQTYVANYLCCLFQSINANCAVTIGLANKTRAWTLAYCVYIEKLEWVKCIGRMKVSTFKFMLLRIFYPRNLKARSGYSISACLIQAS